MDVFDVLVFVQFLEVSHVFLLVQAFPVVSLVGEVNVWVPAVIVSLLLHFPTD